MLNFVLQAHSGWRWIVLALLVITVVKALIGWLGKQKWKKIDTNLVLWTRVAVYLQVILGLILYIMLQQWNNMRLTGEHVVIALLAVGGIEFGAARARRARGRKMFVFAFIGFAIALVLVYVALQAVGGVFV
jgi:hypothetical protein